MESDLMDCLMFGFGPVGPAEAGRSQASDDGAFFQLAHFYSPQEAYNRVERAFKSTHDGPDDFYGNFNLDIPFEHEVILSQGPEGVTDIFSGLQAALPDVYQYGPMDWSHNGATFDGMVGAMEPMAAFASLGYKHSPPAPVAFSDNDDIFLDQLRDILQADEAFSPSLSSGGQSTVTSTRASSVGCDSLYASEPVSGVSSPLSAALPQFHTSPIPTTSHEVGKPEPSFTTRRPLTRMSSGTKMGTGIQAAPTLPLAPAQRRLYVRKASHTPAASRSPSILSSSSGAMKRRGTKVTPKKRTQNRKAAGDYRQRKKLVEEEKMVEHENLLKVRDGLKEQNIALMQELKFAIKMAEARLKRMDGV